MNADVNSDEGRGGGVWREKALPSTEITLATSHESDGEEWVESSSDSSDVSDQDSDRSHSPPPSNTHTLALSLSLSCARSLSLSRSPAFALLL